MRIAIIGAGISGLTAAHLLHREHEVTVFEAENRLGGHTNTVRIDTADQTYALDTGFIVFNDRNYPNFEKLLERLGVGWRESEMSFSVSDERGDFEYSSHSLDGLFATRRNLVSPRFYRMVAEIPRFQRSARELLRSGDADISLRDWLAQQRFSDAFVERLIVPQVSAVWSAEPASLARFPARFLAHFFDNHGMLGLSGRPRWRTVTGGSASYLAPLTAGYKDRVRVAAPVERVTRDGEAGVQVKARGQESESFDRVVIASHSDQALALLGDATPQEREILGAIPYQPNEVVLHTDLRLLPTRQRAWASWNYRLLEPTAARTAVTYHLNRLQGLDSEQHFCVSLNQSEYIDPGAVLRRLEWAHPVYTPEGIRAQARVAEISGTDRTHFCGAYWGWGFHEDGVNSALRVAQELRVAT